ncbi:acyl-CoA dehydrogenase family protein [Salimicrobium humidisoli]|uniref:Isovaleryl-CoA dehydrogenase n=1 Tax=Salimicrobium humidisoli TaxID=2029857 RepID=A0ABX4HUL2_9BACI|nr:acyl-CoA dehydrogenase family protein [Salimicrobium humidisoli]PBB06615.1 isovaleryl-CoA dehydrogenase [Salimicrobium humidisoli]
MKVLTEKYEQHNFYEEDEFLQKILKKYMTSDMFSYADKNLREFGQRAAGPIDERAVHTDREGRPRLERYDKYGEEVSRVWVNEGYKQTVKETYETGIVGYVHKNIPELGEKGTYTYSFAQGYLLSQAEPGFYCPVTLTMATAYLLDHFGDEKLKETYLPHVLATGDTELYEGATFLTERQGGSDVGANVVKAVSVGEDYYLYGEKYFASNAGMCGVAMVLARMEDAKEGSRGLSLFLVPWEGDNIRIRRLKDKLGVRAVPSAEVEFTGTKAYLVGEADRGFYYMMEALNLSRICNAVASLGIMRRSYTEALLYAKGRNAFGRRLADFPMIQQTLSELGMKLEKETAAVFEMVQLYEKVTNGTASFEEEALNRLLIAIMKKETAEKSIEFAHEAIEMHGGNGYIEDFVTPRLLRDAQVLTVWEGTANILALELLRLINKYEAHKLFIKMLREKSTDEMEKRIDGMEDRLLRFADFEETEKELEAKSLMKEMAILYEDVIYEQL